jgi:hypothetical protein
VENLFYEKHLPLLEQGEYFTKHGMFLKRIVELKLIPSRNLFQYSDIDLETRQFTGEIKAIPFDSIKEIKEASTDKENWNHSIILCTDDQQEHRFDAMTLHRKKKWFEAIKNALEVRNGWLFIEKEKKQKQLEEENEEAKKITQMIQQLENQKVLFQEEKLRKRKEKRDELRAKYQLAPLQSNNKHNHHTTAPSAS